MEKRRLEAEGRDKDRHFQLEKERMQLEQKRMSISLEEKKIVEKLHVEKKKSRSRRKYCNHERKG